MLRIDNDETVYTNSKLETDAERRILQEIILNPTICVYLNHCISNFCQFKQLLVLHQNGEGSQY